MFNRTNDTGKIQMKDLDEVKVLRQNVREMQKQLHDHQVRIAELVELVNQQQAQLSYYKNESL